MRKKLNHFVLSILLVLSIANITSSVFAVKPPELPPAPTNVQASDGTNGNQVEVTWDGTSTEGIYLIYRGDDPSSAGYLGITANTQHSFIDTTAVPGSTYYYWVTSCLDGGQPNCNDLVGPDPGWANYCYTLTLTTVGNGSLDGIPTNSPGCSVGDFIENESITLTATSDLGWHLNSWIGTDDDASTSTVNAVTMPASTHEVISTFIQDEYNVTVTIVGTGVVNNTPGNPYLSGSTATLEPVADTGWTFSGWSGANAGELVDNLNGTWDLLMDGNKAVTATFVPVGGGTNILTNTSFETYIPVSWQDGKQITSTDGPDCGAGNARTGDCSVHFEGDGTSKRVFMRYKLGGVAGDNFTLILYRKGASVPAADGAFVKATLYYKDGTQEVFKVNLDTGNLGVWEQFTLPFSASKDYKRVNLDLFYKKASGTMWLDDVSLKRNSGVELLENTSFEIYKPDDYMLAVNLNPNEGPDCSGTNMHSDTCSVHFDGDATNKRLLTRVKHAGGAGDSITISIWRKGVSVPAAGGAFVKVEVFYSDGTSDIAKMDLDVGNLAVWEEITTYFLAAKDYKRFNVDLFYKKASGTLWLDDFTLLVP